METNNEHHILRGKIAGISDRICHICGKEFGASEEYVFKRRLWNKKKYIYFCSYKCMRKYQEEIESKRKRRESI